MVEQHRQKCLLLQPAGSVLLLIAAAAQLLLSSIPAASAARIVVYAYPWASRAFDLVAVSQELAQRGHAVLLIMPRELDDKVVSMLSRDSDAGRGVADQITRMDYNTDSMRTMDELRDANLIKLIKGLERYNFNACAAVIGNQTAVDILYNFGADLVLGDTITCCSWIMADILGVPRVDYNSGAGGAALESVVYGISMPSWAYVPVYSSMLPPTGMTMPQRAMNAALLAAMKAITIALPYSTTRDMRRAVNTTWRNSNLPPPSRHRTVLTISGADLGVELPRPLPPFVRYVGPVLAEPPRPLPPDLADFVEGGHGTGVILAAYGTQMNVNPHSLIALAKAFASLPQRVVWKLTDRDFDHDSRRQFDTITAASGNILVRPWLPQQDLLGHPAVKVFLTHGGIHSIYEGLWHGKPMVVMPLAVDQFDNARLVTDYHGAGLMVDQASLAWGDTVALVSALRQVITGPHYRRRAEELSTRLRAQPGTPRSRAADWVEYALAIGGQPVFFPAEISLPWWQLHGLDLAALAGATLMGLLAAARWCICTRRRRSPRSQLHGNPVSHVKSA